MKLWAAFTLAVCCIPLSAGADWVLVGNNPIPAGDGAVGHDLATDGAHPSVAFVADVAGVKDVRVAVYAEQTNWSLLGPSPSQGASSVAGSVALEFVGSTAYVLYSNGSFPANVHLMQRVGPGWVEFGAPGYASACSSRLALRLAFDGTVPHLTTYGAGGCGLGIDYAFWNGLSWQQRPSATGFPGQLTMNGNGLPDLAFADQAYVAVPELAGGTARIAVRFWSSAGSEWIDLVGPIQENIVNGSGENMAMAADAAGNLYAAWSEQVVSGARVIFVKRYDVVDQTWSLLGGAQASGPNSATYPSLAVIDGAPWLVHLEQTGGFDLVYVRRYDFQTNSWQAIGSPLNQSPTANAFAPAIVGIAGQTFVAYREGAAGTPQDLYVMRFEPEVPVPTLGAVGVVIVTLSLITATVLQRFDRDLATKHIAANPTESDPRAS